MHTSLWKLKHSASVVIDALQRICVVPRVIEKVQDATVHVFLRVLSPNCNHRFCVPTKISGRKIRNCWKFHYLLSHTSLNRIYTLWAREIYKTDLYVEHLVHAVHPVHALLVVHAIRTLIHLVFTFETGWPTWLTWPTSPSSPPLPLASPGLPSCFIVESATNNFGLACNSKHKIFRGQIVATPFSFLSPPLTQEVSSNLDSYQRSVSSYRSLLLNSSLP